LPSNEAAAAGAAGAPAAPGLGEPGPPAAGERLLELVAVMDRLRSQCPWDIEQTHESLAPYLLEETYEALDALASGDAAALREELGDVLLQVVFHARVAAERADGTRFTIDDVADGITAKMKRRHPHVFGDVTVTGADQVSANWDAIKAAERAGRDTGPASALDGVPLAQPALSLATALQRRAERAAAPPELADLAAPADGAERAGGATGTGGAGSVSEIGAELFALADRARRAGLDPELELRSAARVFRDRVRAWERAAAE
jgi:XTP/dITP diphosphohydrolase